MGASSSRYLISFAIGFYFFYYSPALNGQSFYVSPTGSDSNPGTEAEPFQTIAKAREQVRTINRNMTQDVVIYLRGGEYRIDKPIEFDAKDSGFNGHRVVYKRYANETPVVTGGKLVSGWQQEASHLWKAKVDCEDIRQIYVNGHRGIRAKGKPPSGIELLGAGAYKTNDTGLAHWGNPDDIEFIYDNQWDHTICKVKKISADSNGCIVTMLEPYFTLARMKEGKQITLPTSIENALELLDEPGEWYFNRVTHDLYYLPREGESLNDVEVVVPVLERLVEVRGTLDEPVHDLGFEGITFCHAGWNQPSKIGHVEAQANFTYDTHNLMMRAVPEPPIQGSDPTYVSHPHAEAIKTPSNILLHAARKVNFEHCRFNKLGSGGIDVEFGSQDNAIVGCTFSDISGSAIQIGDVVDHHPQDARAIVKNNEVLNNYIHHVANEYLSGVGIFVGYTDGTRIAHNEICELPYTAISIGWGWGEVDVGGGGYTQPFYYDKPSVSQNNICENNHIHHVMQQRWDGGGVYTLGNMPGTVIRGNYIHDNLNWPGGIYLDEGSGFITVTDNVVYNVHSRDGRAAAPFFFNNRRQNRNETCKEHDNFFRIELDRENSQPPQSIVDKAGLEPAYRDLL